ncbi:MAG TPA: alpha/beta hydrolase [Methylibium sp.]|uniref:alpha/beta fold hydrolase n=1 Tax=Methylibium sp. TaxID=2067992 RepID=UPI002DB7248C|nr:alpha/beta hydrolase [Methylibium sp.]HEU4460561.1 alpha/beta hydrolase [Methylibium sp.]
MNAAIERRAIALPHGITLDCHLAGAVDAPVLVFLHGFPEAAFVWEPLLAHFAPRFRCVAPNLRGYAGSSAPAATSAYRVKWLVQDLEALIVEATGGRADRLAAVVAHDWGGAVAWMAAIHRPELVRRLVVVNSPHPGPFLRDLRDDPAQQAASRYMNFLCRDDAAALLAEDGFRRLFDFFLRMGGDAWLTPALRARYAEVWSKGLEPMLAYYRASPLRPPTPADPGAAGVTLTDAQMTVQLPTTVIWGDADTALPLKLVEGLERWVPRMKRVRVAGATHWIVHEQPERVIAEIDAAL